MRTSALSMALLVATGAVAQNKTTCANGLFIVVARGTGETQGTGITGVIAEAIAKEIKTSSKTQAVVYPATFTDPDYNISEKEGVDALQELLTSYHSACPKDKIAYLGYSQGGQIAMDAFCGGAGGSFSTAQALPSSLVDDSVVAIVVFGDPSHVANVTYNKGTSKKNGIFPRKNSAACDDYSDILRSYCDTGDVYCDSGNDRKVHTSYVERYGQDVAQFVVKQYEDSLSSSGGSSSTTTSPTASSTGAAGSGSSTSATPSGSASSVPGNAGSTLAPKMAFAVAAPLAMAVFGLML